MKDTLMNREFEEAFLGSCLVDSQVFINSNLAVPDFMIVAHQLIYKAIATVHADTGKTDPLLVADQLKKDGDLNRVGGMDIIYQLQAVIVETESAPYYEIEIKRLATKRQICAIAKQAIAQAEDESSDAEQVAAKLELDLRQLEFEQRKLDSYSVFELSRMEIEPVKWFIPNMLPSGLTILAGPPKIGKSFFCWNMAISVAVGGAAFSSIQIEQRHNVTYLSLEDPPALLKDRLDLISPDVKPSNLHIIHDLHQKKLDAVGLKMIEEHLDKTASELLIVDTWKHVAPQIDSKGTSYDVDYESLIPIQQFAHRRNMGIVLVTHTRKAADIDNVFNQIQGSVGMQASCDTLMMISHDSGAKTLHLSGRRIPTEQYALTISDGIWCLEGTAAAYHGSALRQEIVSLLREAGQMGLSARDIIEMTGKNDKTIYSTLRRMVINNEIDQPKKRGDYFHRDDQDDEIDL